MNAPIQIVATWHNLLILRDGEVLDNLTEPETGHYGVTWNERHLFALFASTKVLDGTRQVIRVFDRQLQPVRDILAGEIAGVHQIIWHDDYLWIMSTNTDEIVVSDEDGNVHNRWQPANDPQHPGIHHVNSIWLHGGCIYTLAHGMEEGDPAIYCHAYPGFELLGKWPIVRGAHNIFYAGQYLYLLKNGVCFYGQPPVVLPACEMMRGLSVTKERVYVGSSKVIEDRAARRADPTGVVWELDRQFNVLKKHDLNVGPVGEIRTLNRPDFAHHGLPWTGKYGMDWSEQ